VSNIVYTNAMNAEIKQPVYIKQYPYVDDQGIYIPVNEYVLEGEATLYRLVLSTEMFVEAYNKWIKGDTENEKD
jgi:hypothetical protein